MAVEGGSWRLTRSKAMPLLRGSQSQRSKLAKRQIDRAAVRAAEGEVDRVVAVGGWRQMRKTVRSMRSVGDVRAACL